MSMDSIRRFYGVPAKRGGRVVYTGGTVPAHGTIVGSRGDLLRVRLDGTGRTLLFHPAWALEYLDGPKADVEPEGAE